MSTQKGNNQRTRPQKHKNKTSFKNTLHDTSQRTKVINNIQVSNVCMRCKEIIEWKIKYKKYKPLSQPRKCVRCDLKNVKQAYHVMCGECGKKLGLCTKCCEAKEVVGVQATEQEQVKLDNEMKALLQSLPERKRRTFLRYMNKDGEEKDKDLKGKLEELKIEDEFSDESDLEDEFSDKSESESSGD